jgi:hypothetical protein
MSNQTAPECIITTIGIDLGKNTFHLIGMDARGRIVLRRKVSRGQLLQLVEERVAHAMNRTGIPRGSNS